MGWICILAASALACEADQAPAPVGKEVLPAEPMPKIAEPAFQVVSDIRARFAAQEQFPDRTRIAERTNMLSPVLGPGQVVRLDRDGAWIHPVLSRATAPNVVLPIVASGPFRLADTSSALDIEVSLSGMRDAPAELAAGIVVYRDAYGPGSHVLHRVTPIGTEDYVLLENPMAVPALRYDVLLGQHIAGLRLVANTLEFLDIEGAPRLRVAPPYVVTADGVQRAARLAVDGCAVDTSSRAPWGRAVTEPGAQRCDLTVTWDGDEVAYPIIVDPQWTTTAAMAVARYSHTSTVLGAGPSAGRVLAAGGFGQGVIDMTSCELYDPATGTWAVTSSLVKARANHTATPIAAGILLAGGESAPTAEVYSPATGQWTLTGDMFFATRAHTATALPSGKILIAGGTNETVGDPNALASWQMYKPATDDWTTGQGIQMTMRRHSHSATLLPNGKVLIAGGRGGTFPDSGAEAYLAEAEVFDESNGWTSVSPMSEARSHHQAALVPEGSAIVIGGSSNSGVLSSVEIYSVATNQWSSSASMDSQRISATASTLGNGCVLIAGGGGSVGATLSTVEILDPATLLWSSPPPMFAARKGHAASILEDGRLLISGGRAANETIPEAELLSLSGNGAACASDCECLSGSCVDDVCCQTACDGPCEVCSVGGACEPAAPGTDPRSACADEGAASCGQNGTCDDKGACALYLEGVECGEKVCTEATIVTAKCNGAGECLAASMNCAPYICEGTTCTTTCISIDGCAAGSECDFDGKCVAPLPPLHPSGSGGCGCRLSSAGREAAHPWLALVIAIQFGVSRRRRRCV